uniref:Riboflavin kinase n=1 Tax=Chlamydomonas leiostraca TaxID=1034604 RepID=A0A7S0S042_9CHLO
MAPLLDPDLVVSAVYVDKGKPAPDVYLEALRRTGCANPARALVIEDTVNGLMAAKAAGVFAVGVTNSLPREVLRPHADRVVSHLLELDLATLVPDHICCPK